MATPLERYERDLERGGFARDAAQAEAVAALDDLYQRLAARRATERGAGGLWRRLRRRGREPEQGLYLWGGVGRGKTWLMDSFFDCLPPEERQRVHFHRFMQRVHRELQALAGEKNPLDLVAVRLAGQTSVLCFDEFFVSDIADAMILGKLLEALLGRGITLVATSNIPPPRLYENGLQRQRFLPAIALIEAHTRVMNVDGGIDYRLRTLESADLYYHPLGERAMRCLAERFDRLAPESGLPWERLEINGRYLTARCLADDVAWFEFDELCRSARSQNDYIELARIFHAVVLSGVQRMDGSSDDVARRFINLVDEFYDRNVKLVIAAETVPADLYSGSGLAFEFERTVSRLQEMQSRQYLAREHRP